MSAKAAREAWRSILDLMVSPRAHSRMGRACAAVDVSPGVLKTLFHLQPGGEVAMRDLADYWGCDASYVTAMTDALEERGLVERRPHPKDRRIKMIALTPKGVRARERAAEVLYDPPASFAALTAAEQRQLRDLLRKLAAAERGQAEQRSLRVARQA
jgi:DNA-binding MarR family transcriptional regulator